MPTSLFGALLIGCPLIGALCALVANYRRWWQVLFGAVAGVAIADVIIRVGSKYAIRSAMTGQAVGVTIWSAEVDWSSRAISSAILLAIALAVGGLVLVVRRFASPPN
jgi:hypothetical protein